MLVLRRKLPQHFSVITGKLSLTRVVHVSCRSYALVARRNNIYTGNVTTVGFSNGAIKLRGFLYRVVENICKFIYYYDKDIRLSQRAVEAIFSLYFTALFNAYADMGRVPYLNQLAGQFAITAFQNEIVARFGSVSEFLRLIRKAKKEGKNNKKISKKKVKTLFKKNKAGIDEFIFD